MTLMSVCGGRRVKVPAEIQVHLDLEELWRIIGVGGDQVPVSQRSRGQREWPLRRAKSPVKRAGRR